MRQNSHAGEQDSAAAGVLPGQYDDEDQIQKAGAEALSSKPTERGEEYGTRARGSAEHEGRRRDRKWSRGGGRVEPDPIGDSTC